MLKQKALKKILINSITLLVLLTLYLIPNIENKETLKTNLELEYISGVGTNSIYLLDENNYLVKTRILLTSNSLEKKVNTLIDNLIINKNNTFPDSLKGTIPEKTKLLGISIENKIVVLNFSKEFLNVNSKLEDRMFESIVYSLLDLKELNGVQIKINGERLGNYPNSKVPLPDIMTKDIGINKQYHITKRKDINKVVVYYIEKIDNVNYYVPVTKYMNDSRDKVKIIIENLATSYIYEPNLMSFLNNNTKLNSYNEEENIMFLDFNNNIYNNNDTILEEVIYSISYSIFDNYNVRSVVFTVDGNNLQQVNRSELY